MDVDVAGGVFLRPFFPPPPPLLGPISAHRKQQPTVVTVTVTVTVITVAAPGVHAGEGMCSGQQAEMRYTHICGITLD